MCVCLLLLVGAVELNRLLGIINKRRLLIPGGRLLIVDAFLAEISDLS